MDIELQNGEVINRQLRSGQTQSIGPQYLATSQVIYGIIIGSGGNSTVSVAFYTYSSTDRIEGNRPPVNCTPNVGQYDILNLT